MCEAVVMGNFSRASASATKRGNALGPEKTIPMEMQAGSAKKCRHCCATASACSVVFAATRNERLARRSGGASHLLLTE